MSDQDTGRTVGRLRVESQPSGYDMRALDGVCCITGTEPCTKERCRVGSWDAGAKRCTYTGTKVQFRMSRTPRDRRLGTERKQPRSIWRDNLREREEKSPC